MFASVFSTFIYEDGELQEVIECYAYNVFQDFLISWKRRRESYTLLLRANEITLTRVQ
jgi:hypothetical protein